MLFIRITVLVVTCAVQMYLIREVVFFFFFFPPYINALSSHFSLPQPLCDDHFLSFFPFFLSFLFFFFDGHPWHVSGMRKSFSFST